MIRVSTAEAELAYEWRALVEIAVADPFWSRNKVDNPGPTHPRPTVRPHFEVRLLVPLQLWRFEFFCFALILDRLLADPADREGADGFGDEIRIFARTLDRIEYDLELWRDRDTYQRRLRCVGITDCAEDAQSTLRHEIVNIRLSHGEMPR